MIRAGFVIQNPITQSRTVVIESDAETHGRGWLIEVTCVPNSGPDTAEHRHLSWTETFEIFVGKAHYRLNGVQKTATAGDIIVMPANQPHIHPWNAGDLELVYRQRTDFGKPSSSAVQDILGVMATMTGLAREGKVNTKGLPKSLLRKAVTMRTFIRHGCYDARLSARSQHILASTLGKFAEWLGYRAVDPKYSAQPAGPVDADLPDKGV